MITMQEILKSAKLEDQTPEIQANLLKLLDICNKLRTLWNKPMTVTSGLRTMEDHLRIYKEKGITDKSKIPMKSNHLFGLACDFADSDLSMTKWLKAHPEILEELDAYCEDGNANWVHIQVKPFGSYKKDQTRWFKP